MFTKMLEQVFKELSFTLSKRVFQEKIFLLPHYMHDDFLEVPAKNGVLEFILVKVSTEFVHQGEIGSSERVFLLSLIV